MVVVVARLGSCRYSFVAAAALLGFAALLLLAHDAEASHYRAGTMSWETNPTTIGSPQSTVTLDTFLVFRADFFCNPCAVGQNVGAQGPIHWGDGTSTTMYDAIVTFKDSALNLVYVQLVASGTMQGLQHSYQGPGPYNVSWQACCRLSLPAHRNNPDSTVALTTSVPGTGTNRSPDVISGGIASCQLNTFCTFQVQASDADGEPLSYRLSTSTEATGSGGSFYHPGPCPSCGTPAAASIDPTSGAYTWNTTGASMASGGQTYYSSHVMVDAAMAPYRWTC